MKIQLISDYYIKILNKIIPQNTIFDVVDVDEYIDGRKDYEIHYEGNYIFIPESCAIVFKENISNKNTNKSIEWEQRRYELAKEYSKEFVQLQHYKGMTETGVVSSKVAAWSVELADALIEELKKKK